MLEEKIKYLNSIRVFLFFDLIFSVEMKQTRNLQEKTRERSEAVASAYNFIKKETLPHVFSCEFCEISKNTYSNKTLPVAASERWKIVKQITLQIIFLHKLLEIG